MPQRYSRYGYGPSEEELQNLGGPFFNPYSKRGDVGYALRQAVNMLLAKKREEQDTAKERAKTDWEQKFKEAQLALEERRTAVAERPDIQKPPIPEKQFAQPDLLVMAEKLVESGMFDDTPPNKRLGMAFNYILSGQHPSSQRQPAKTTASQVTAFPTGGTTQLAIPQQGAPAPGVMPPMSPHVRPNQLSATIEGDNVVFNGKKYKISKDGIVVIEGKPYAIR